MAPPKKSKSLKKGPPHSNDPSAEENYRSSQTSKKRKKKLSDKLGPQWSKEEIESFYEAYRKYGQDWKKVASSMHERSTEMVETLYNMSKAYLSLPEGAASVVGFIALMTDYYNVMVFKNFRRLIKYKFNRVSQMKAILMLILLQQVVDACLRLGVYIMAAANF